MKKILIFLLLFGAVLFASPNFPNLTAQVVDEVGLLSQSEKSSIISKLEAHQKATSNQIVVVILKDLDSYDIADYSYQLGRHWGIGQKNKNNGVLLVFAMKERKMRIEVGYGLEGVLTDVIAHDIIQTKITPKFKQKEFSQGILSGVNSIVLTLAGKYTKSESNNSNNQSNNSLTNNLGLFVFISLILNMFAGTIFEKFIKSKSKVKIYSSLFTASVTSIVVFVVTMSMLITFFAFVIVYIFGYFNNSKNASSSNLLSGSSSGYSSSSFSGGGGSFGGGGASGGW